MPAPQGPSPPQQPRVLHGQGGSLLPGNLPQHCPRCGGKLTLGANYQARPAKMGRLLQRLGWFGGPLVLLIVLVANSVLSPETELTRVISFRMFVGVLLPTIFLEGLALIWPKVRTMRCHHCHWQMDFPWNRKR